MPEKEFEYSKPQETENKMHRLNLNVDGIYVGYAEMEYHSEPFPFYFIDEIYIMPEFRGQGLGGKITAELNDFLVSKNSAGILLNAIDQESSAGSMYQKYGWKKLDNYRYYYIYNSPENMDNARISVAIYKIRQSKKRRYETAEKTTD